MGKIHPKLKAKNWREKAGIHKIGDRQGTTKKLCDAERSGELSSAICLTTLDLLGNYPVTPTNSIVQKILWCRSRDFLVLWVPLTKESTNLSGIESAIMNREYGVTLPNLVFLVWLGNFIRSEKSQNESSRIF